MPDSYSITITNASNSSKQFLLFQALPKPLNVPGDDVFANVYQSSVNIEGNGESNVSFNMTNEWYAIYGTSNRSPDGKVRVSTSSSKPVSLGPDGSYNIITTYNKDGKSPEWKDAGGKTTAAPGAFSIATDGTFNFPNKLYFGAGAVDPDSGKVILVQTYPAKPNVVSQLFPKVKYYIAWGSYQPGSIIDLSELGNVLQVDFSTASSKDASFTLTANNSYTPDISVGQAGIKWTFSPAA
ncbi:hypothetical protein FOWG_16781 [Fusarium oxysporum f. sp. lycopersici MN25]|nr:hypothetical protein FOWG_16781 [Fusarium oxysporum f. sp. lycopersici MN25]